MGEGFGFRAKAGGHSCPYSGSRLSIAAHYRITLLSETDQTGRYFSRQTATIVYVTVRMALSSMTSINPVVISLHLLSCGSIRSW